ncbi:MAG: vWA domain-containing protein [Alphaproteobacteria bacterium]|nr:vWA domain-containing protein [Alphaproteobacteria bacterium]
MNKRLILALSAFLAATAVPAAPSSAFLWGSDEETGAVKGTGREGKCGATDLVIAIDTTHSMAAAIREMKREAIRLIDLVSFVSAGDFRLGLVSFRDTVRVDVDLGSVADPGKAKDAITWAIRRLQAEGGNGGPEASDEALRTAVVGLSAADRAQEGDFRGEWQARSRILVLITDNLPGGFDDSFDEGVDDVNAREITTEALRRDIRISSVYIPTAGFQLSPDPRVIEIMRAYPQLTGGVFSVTEESGRGTAEAIADIVDRCGMRPLS